MFLKLQLVTNSLPFQTPITNKTTSSSTNTVLPVSVNPSISPLHNHESTNPHLEKNGVSKTHNGAVKKFRRYERSSVVVREPIKNTDREPRDRFRDGVFSEKNESSDVELRSVSENFGVKKVHTKCSTKWGSYGGCIPSILEALDTIKDLDVALSPWKETLSDKERSIILKEQCNWERALEIFEWFKSEGCYDLNVIHYNIMLRILGKVRQWSHLECLWNEMCVNGISAVNSTYGTLIDVYSKGGYHEKALDWLAKMNEQGMEPDEVTLGIVVQMYKKMGEFRKAEEFFKKWSSGDTVVNRGRTRKGSAGIDNAAQGNVSLSSHTYNTMIDMYGKAGQLKEASETFSKMVREGIVPTTVTFNTMIHICGNHGQLKEVGSLMEKMEELHCPPDTRTYNILISLHAKHNDIRMAASYFKKMKVAKLEPDIVSYRTLLYAFSIRHMVSDAEALVLEMDERGFQIDEYTQSALTRMYIEAGMLEKSWTWFMRFHLSGTMTSGCYSANIDAFGEGGYILEAEKVFRCCQERKKLTVLEFNVMIKAYTLGHNYDKACRLFDNMETCGVVPDRCSYSSIVQALAAADRTEEAKHYLQKMQQAGLVIDCVPYCAVISSFIKLGNIQMAENLYKEMIAFKIKPDIVAYGVLINGFADAGCVKEALDYVNAMKKEGLPGNEVIYNSLLKLYTKVGYLKEAEEVYKLLQSLDTGPDVYSSNCMIDLYSEQSMVKKAEGIFESMKKNGVANEFTYSMMLCMYKRLARFEEAHEIAKQMRELELLTSLLSYNNLLGLYALDGRFNEAVKTFKNMVEAGIQPDESTFKSLSTVLVKCGISKKAIGKLEATTKNDYQNGLQAWLRTLSAMVRVDEEDDDDLNLMQLR